jgi:hypothetical protein
MGITIVHDGKFTHAHHFQDYPIQLIFGLRGTAKQGTDPEPGSRVTGAGPHTRNRPRAVTVLLTKEHLRKMIEDHLLKENEIGNWVTLALHRAKAVGYRLGTSVQAGSTIGMTVRGLVTAAPDMQKAINE